MAEGMPHSELLRRALEWILSEKQGRPASSWGSLLDHAGMRFNLSPRDGEALRGILEEKKKELHAL
jgi:hypothetical protein